MIKENTYKINYNNIENYYHELGNELINKLIEAYNFNTDYENLINVSVEYNLYLFKFINKQWQLKTLKQIISDLKNKKRHY